MKPEIRLQYYNNEWQEPLIDNIFDVRNGYTPSKNIKEYWKNGTIPWFRMEDIRVNGGILKDAIQHITPLGVKGGGLFETNSIILATTATIGVHAMLIADSLANQRFTNFKICKSLINDYDPYFVYYAFFKIDEWAKQNTNSGGLLSVDVQGLLKQPFVSPNIEEQKSIAYFFSNLDILISASTSCLASLKQIKAASLQSMFPQEGETTPRIRFKGFEGEWKKTKLSSMVKRITRKNTNLETTLPVTISAADGIVEQTSFFNNVVASSNLSGYYLIEKGEFAYNKSYSNGYPYGAVKRMIRYDKGALSTLYIVFKIDETLSSDYLLYFFETTLWHGEIVKRASEGARNHGLLNIGAENFLDIDIIIPLNISEQQKIADYFKTLDRQITLQTLRLEKLKQIKAACLDKMFV